MSELRVQCTTCGRVTDTNHYIEVNGALLSPICKVCNGKLVVAHTASSEAGDADKPG